MSKNRDDQEKCRDCGDPAHAASRSDRGFLYLGDAEPANDPGVLAVRAQAQQEAMSDGLYRVTTAYLCAGFVVAKGAVVRCAPILRKKLAYWRGAAVRV